MTSAGDGRLPPGSTDLPEDVVIWVAGVLYELDVNVQTAAFHRQMLGPFETVSMPDRANIMATVMARHAGIGLKAATPDPREALRIRMFEAVVPLLFEALGYPVKEKFAEEAQASLFNRPGAPPDKGATMDAKNTCHYCQKAFSNQALLRPYGPDGAMVCHPCATGTPERKAEAERQIEKVFNAHKKAGQVSVITGDGAPRGIKVGES